MELKPGYKLTEVGVIPEDWNVKSFGDLFDLRNGVNADKDAYGQGVPFINVLEPITYSHLFGPEITGQVTLHEAVAASYAVRHGDILFNRTSETQGEVGLAATYLGTDQVVFGGFVIRGRPKDDSLDPTYSGYALRTPAIRSQIIAMGQGAIRANIGQENLRRVLAPVPPPAEQRAIAGALSDVDALIGALDQLLAKKRDLKQAAMQQLLTGHQRLPSFAPANPRFKQTDAGMIPDDWQSTTIGDMAAKVGSGITPTGGERVYKQTGRPFVRSQNVGWGRLLLGELAFIDDETHARFSETEIQNRDVLLNITGASIGRSAVADSQITGGNVNQHVCIIRPCDDELDPVYLNRLLLSDIGQRQIDSFQAGGNRQGLNFAQIRSLRLPRPSLAEQTAIAEVLSDMDAELAALEQKRDKTRLLKQGMMQELLTGRTRLI